MQDFFGAFLAAFNLMISLDADLLEIVGLSIRVTFAAVVISCLIGFPLGAILAVSRFPGRSVISVFMNAAMGMPPVVVGLLVYMLLSKSGPLAVLNLLYTPTAMIIAQVVLVTPIVTALTRQVILDMSEEFGDLLTVMGATRFDAIGTLLWEARPALITAALAGFGRAFAEVGAVMIVGGNINHLTRMMTTAIALETSRGALALALALGIILLAISFLINASLMAVRVTGREAAHG